MHHNRNEYERFGYDIFGPFLLEYIVWLHRKIIELRRNNQKTKFYFLSREGLYIHKCYELLYGKMDDAEDLFISRKCVRFCDIAGISSVSELISVIDFRANATVDILLDKCGIDLSMVSEQLIAYNIDLNDQINEDIYPFINSIFNIIQNTAKDQMRLLTQYLQELGFLSCSNVVFIDIGWRGTMQKTVSRIYKKDIFGLYVGIIGSGINGEGFLNNVDQILEAGMTLIESLFMVNFGTTIGYELSSKGVKPVLQDSEFEDEEYRTINDIQFGAKKYFTQVKENSLDRTKIVERFIRVIVQPSLREARLLGEIVYFDSFKSKLAKVNYYNVKKSFLSSGWKIGALKLIFKVPFINYLKMYSFLKNGLTKKQSGK